jgi:ribosomal protein L11 methyltransferase
MLHSVSAPEVTVEKLQQQDWLAQVAKSFPPIAIGRFYVHGSHVKDSPPGGSIAIQVDAGAAFGSGEHGTTRCCLEALDWLSRKHEFTRILDMGCGSGILAIAAARLWRAPVLAVDIDTVAVKVTQENVQINRVTQYVTAAESDGYSGDAVRRGTPYQLIISNILARPLIEFAPHLARNLASGGIAVLSGLLVAQEQQVLSAHTMQGLKLVKKFAYEDWATLVLAKN